MGYVKKKPAFTAGFFISLFCLSACATDLSRDSAAPLYIDANGMYACHGYGCSWRTPVRFTETMWPSILAPFTPTPQNAKDERVAIAQAAGMMRGHAASQAGTDKDAPGAPMIISDDPTQMDCIDETMNTINFLRLIAEKRPFRFHDIGQPVVRGAYALSSPHHSATITEKETGETYVIDPWLSKIGEPALVQEVAAWEKD